MNSPLPNSMPEPVQLALLALALAAAFTDLRARRIPNWLTLAGITAGMGLNFWFESWSGLRHSLLGMALGAGLFLALYMTGGMGAGDVKLLAAVGSLVGPQPLLVIFVLTGIFGGVAALALLLARGRLGDGLRRTAGLTRALVRHDWAEVMSRSDRHAAGALSLPYGAVVASGALVFLFAVRSLAR